MRSPILIAASLLLLATGADAQTMPYPAADMAPIASVQVTAPVKSVRIRVAEAQKISGSYEMSNGWYLRVLTSARHIDAIIDEQRPIRLLAVAPYRFVSADGNVTMDFNRGRDGEDMRMSYVPDLRLGQRVMLESRLAQR
ncbi:hypothetical protein [Massilia alkalitolerans]|uniref:hypothetical protein n=1 Tax=Massilia alkalitolerans TaxID=286638 RepID=UPI0028B0C4E2|nr:hypothetical protein [Massilia alkalitolerans]